MDALLLARLQFTLTIMFHYVFPPLSIGLGVIMVMIEGKYVWTGNPLYKQMARFWSKVFALTFSMGVATGIVMEFEFGTNWATYSRYVGDVFGSALAAEGVFAFFLESGFLAILLFGWDRVGKKLHYFSTVMVCLGAHFSAVWIVVANSWMQTPAGFEISGDGLDARAVITDFWAMVFNPSSMDRLIHTLLGAWLAGAFLVISVSAYYLLKKRHEDFSRASLNVGLILGFVACILQAMSGDSSAEIVAKHQPSKLAAMEGLYHNERNAPLYLFGVPDSEAETVRYGVAIPSMLSLLVYGDADAEVAGLSNYPKEDWPKVGLIFQTYRIMIVMWVVMMALTVLAFWKWWRGTLLQSRWLLKALVWAVLCPQIANQTGWITAEVGRYPWIVYNLLRISDGLSKSVAAEQILSSTIMFGTVYLMLFCLFLYLLDHKIKNGPVDTDKETTYAHLRELAKELEQ
ncbi:MAG: cytochrome ubiquinol oxidase subunit I [Chlamydiia bacterium]|nr:cytochrome ubiquinol oxidase subunit I [Chlamydiia bacterium]